MGTRDIDLTRPRSATVLAGANGSRLNHIR
jgi:hypothetical protein